MPHFSKFATATIMETAFGMKPTDRSEDEERDLAEFVQASEDAFNVIIARILQPWLLVDAIFRLSPTGRVQRRAETIISDYARRVIVKKKAQMQQREQEGGDDEGVEEDEDDGVRKKYTFLDLALSGKADVLSDDEVLEEVSESWDLLVNVYRKYQSRVSAGSRIVHLCGPQARANREIWI